jgi:hypothetical protein
MLTLEKLIGQILHRFFLLFSRIICGCHLDIRRQAKLRYSCFFKKGIVKSHFVSMVEFLNTYSEVGRCSGVQHVLNKLIGLLRVAKE